MMEEVGEEISYNLNRVIDREVAAPMREECKSDLIMKQYAREVASPYIDLHLPRDFYRTDL